MKKNVWLNFLGKKWWVAKGICSEFRQNKGVVSSVNNLLWKINKTGSVERKVGSGRPRSVGTQQNISRVSELICSQENKPGTSKSPCEIQKVTGISHSSVRRIAKRDLRFKVFRRKKTRPAGRVLINISFNKSTDQTWQTEGGSSSERWTHWTIVLNKMFIFCHALLCVSLCLCVSYAF